MEGFKVNVAEQKSRIADYVKNNGPLVAHAISKTLNLNSFLASALLSELLREKVILSSNLKVGGSPLYFVRGQEEKLEGYTKFLDFKEREAHTILKEKGVAEDKKCEPAIRVAFRNMKDFAMPMTIVQSGEEKLFWRFHLLQPEEAGKKIKSLLTEEAPSQTPAVKSSALESPKIPEKELKAETEKEVLEKPSEELSKEDEEERVPDLEKTLKKPRKKSPAPSSFNNEVKSWMEENKVALKREVDAGGKDFKAIVEVESGIGKLDFFLFGKNKKSINEGDVALIYQEGADLKLPVLFLTKGKLSKKGEEVAENLKGKFVIRKL